MPQPVLDAFEKEYGVKVIVESYDSEEGAADNVRNEVGQYDLVVLPPEQIPGLVTAGKLAQIDPRAVPNFKNVSANFRDLVYDPGNHYSIPFHWGSTGLLVRSDLVKEPVSRWADLWDPRFAGKVAIWPVQRSMIPIALKSLGYPANSEDPRHLDQARERLLALKDHAFLISNKEASIVPYLMEGPAVIGYGWAYDALLAQEENLPIAYILPEEGSVLWSDNFVIPANSQRKHTAEVFINFVLSAEISAQIINESYYPMANDAALPFVDPAILNNPIIYPSNEMIKNAEIILSLSDAGRQKYDDVWKSFLSAFPPIVD
jgi:spermidine/putrescine transport system substrate-binding protein